jgi:hypothetical protein
VVTVRDGAASATGQTTVTVRSLTGTWRSEPFTTILGTLPAIWTLTQTGSAIGGGLAQGSGAGTILDGAVSPTSPRVRFTVVVSASGLTFAPFEFTGEPDANTLTGVLNGSGFVNTPLTLTRQ